MYLKEFGITYNDMMAEPAEVVQMNFAVMAEIAKHEMKQHKMQQLKSKTRGK